MSSPGIKFPDPWTACRQSADKIHGLAYAFYSHASPFHSVHVAAPCLHAVKRLTAQNRLPHLLFYGPPGTGKTTTVLAIAKQIYGASMQNMVLELNASDDR